MLPENKVEADIARKIMDEFAVRTGIDHENKGNHSRRYLGFAEKHKKVL